jgi:EAL domain-containing protein (putative c-di-GMP-specific phosphodiesterase class I)
MFIVMRNACSEDDVQAVSSGHVDLDRLDLIGGLDSIIFFPVRAASDAKLVGFEVRAFPMLLRSGQIPPEANLRPDCPCLSAAQISHLLLSSSFGRLFAEWRLVLWLPLTARALSDRRSGMAIEIGIRDHRIDPGNLVLVLPFPNDEPCRMPEGADSLVRMGVRVAVSHQAASRPEKPQHMPGVNEIRLSAICWPADSIVARMSIPQRIGQLKQSGLTVTALDIATSLNCQIAIQSQVDFVQGDFVGRPLPASIVARRIARAASVEEAFA